MTIMSDAEPVIPIGEKAESGAILFIDDDESILHSLQRALRSEPFHVYLARGAAEALEILREHAVQIVVTDIGMPEIDGLALLDLIAGRYPDTVRLVLSGRANAATIIKAIDAGSIYRYILKPWDTEELKITMRQALALWRLQADNAQLLQLLQIQNKALEERVAQRTKQILAIERQADIGRYAAQLVHNLNNPLHVLSGALDLLALHLSGDPVDKTRTAKSIAFAQTAADDLKKIVAGVLSHARSEAHNGRQPIDINPIIEKEIGFFEIVPEFKHKVQKKIELDPELPRIMGNPTEIKQILDNLIKNALDAMEGSPQQILSVRTAAQNTRAEIIVSDTGCGIPQDHFERIFSPDFTTKAVDRGTGLGLASVKAMVDAYSGAIAFESVEGQGTTFRVSLPAIQSMNPIRKKIL